MVSDPNEPVTIEKALDRFLLQLEADGRSEHTIAQYRRHVRLLIRWLAAEREFAVVAVLRPELVARFMVSTQARARFDGKPKKPTSVNGLRSSIRTFCTYLHDTGLVPSNPARLLRRAICSPRRSRALDENEIERFMAVLQESTDAPGQRDRMLFTLMLATGIRIGSALGLDAEDVDLDRGELLLRRLKAGRMDRVFFPATMTPALRECVSKTGPGPLFRNGRGERLTARHASRRLAVWFAHADVLRVHGTHCLRHTFAARLLRRTKDVLLVREALLHRSITSTLSYTDRDEDRLRAVVGGS